MNANKRATADAKFTAAPIQESGANDSTAREFCRVPDLDPLFGLKRGIAYQGIKDGWFKSICLRKPGAKTGVRLVHVQSVRDWLNSKLA